MSTKRKPEPEVVEAPPFDPEQVVREQVAEHIGAHPVDHRRRELAVSMHTARVREAGQAVPLNWYARRVLSEGGGP